MTLSASNNSVNYTGEVDVNVIPEIMQITDGGYSEDLINVGDKVMIQSKLKGLPTGG
ncbi:hypothetical protein FACS1894166_11560 [Bacilli bacterium]|nr:hypothetical protein FACS1894166_11560 [Bacilli bacterium]